MTRTELLEKICPTHNTDGCTGGSGFDCDDCKKLMESWFDKYDRQIRADAIEEVRNKMFSMPAFLTVDDVRRILDKLKERNEQHN